VSHRRGFTLLEMLVATTIMGVAIAALMTGLSGATRNAARLRDYDRVVQLARLRMNDILADRRVPRNTQLSGTFPPELVGGLHAGWTAVVTVATKTPQPMTGAYSIDRVLMELWWMAGSQRRTLTLESYRGRQLLPEEVE
jgi:general secretion pathway protein I